MKKLVIIGGGFAGSFIARTLEREFDTTLIDTKDFFEFTPGILRTIVEPKHMNKIQIMYKDYLEKTKIIMEEANYVDDKSVRYDGKDVKYDYLVVCSGSSYKEPIKEQHVVHASRAKHLADAYERLMKAKDVVIIGGGLAGVELTAEIACKYPEKKLTLIHSKDKLIPRNNVKSQNYAEYFLRKKGVNIIFGERVVSGDKKNVKTDKGTIIKADMVLLCTGIKPNSGFLKGKLRNFLDEKGFLKVNEYMQADNCKNIFAPGDINACDVEKTAQNAEHQAKIVINNIMALEKGREMKKYVEKKTPMVISLGKLNGIFEYKRFVFTGFLPAVLKWAIERREMIRIRL